MQFDLRQLFFLTTSIAIVLAVGVYSWLLSIFGVLVLAIGWTCWIASERPKNPSHVLVRTSLILCLLFLPFGICGYVVVFGGEFPLGGVLLGIPIGVAIAVGMGAFGIRLCARGDWRKVIALTAVLWIFNLAWIPIGRIMNSVRYW